MSTARDQDVYADLCLHRACDTLGLDARAIEGRLLSGEADVDVDVDLAMDADVAPPWHLEPSVIVEPYPVLVIHARSSAPPPPTVRRPRQRSKLLPRLALFVCGAIAAFAAFGALHSNPRLNAVFASTLIAR